MVLFGIVLSAGVRVYNNLSDKGSAEGIIFQD
jgi:hypothetical protein